MDRIFIIFGPNIKEDGKFKEGKILGLPPTILELLDLKAPSSMDNHSITKY